MPFIHGEHEIPYDFQRPTRYGLKRWYSHAGFELISVKPASSSMDTINSLINLAIFEPYNGVRSEIKKGGVNAFKVFMTLLLYFLLLKPFMKLLMAIYDGYPDENRTMFPIGWIAEAKKPGILVKTEVLDGSKGDFLEKNILKDQGFVFSNGVISWKED